MQQCRLRANWRESKFAEKSPGGLDGQQVGHEPGVLMCSFPAGNGPWIVLTSEPCLDIV